MLVVSALLIIALFPMVPIYLRLLCPKNVFDWLLSDLLDFSFCVFVFIPLGVSSGFPMFNLVYWACSCFPPWSVPRISRRPCSWLSDFTTFSVFGHPELSVLLDCGVLAVHAWGCAIGGSSGLLFLRITCCVHDNAENSFFALVVFTRKWGTKCLSFSWTYGGYNLLIETSFSHLKSWITIIILSPRFINLRKFR